MVEYSYREIEMGKTQCSESLAHVVLADALSCMPERGGSYVIPKRGIKLAPRTSERLESHGPVYRVARQVICVVPAIFQMGRLKRP